MHHDFPFSLIIPARDASRTLPGCLAAAAASSCAPAEIIVVNDGSRDRTSQLALRHGARVIDTDIRRGPMQPRWVGAEAASSPLLVFVDADVEVRPDTFEKLLRHFRDPEVHAVTGTLSGESRGLSFTSAFKSEYMNFIFSRQPRRSRFLYGSVWAIRKESLVCFEPISDPFGSLVSDSELGLRLAREGKAAILDHTAEVDHRKRYTLLKLLQNDFAIPFMFALAFLKYASRADWRSFSHATLGQTASTAAAWFSVTAGVFYVWTRENAALLAAGLGLFFVYSYWAPFLIRLLNRKGRAFCFGAACLLPLDAAVMFAGMCAGFAYGAWKSMPRPLCLKSA